MTPNSNPIENGGSEPDVDMRRSGGSLNDPHGGHEHLRPHGASADPDPISELATVDDTSPDNRPDVPHLSAAKRPQPGFGPDGTKQPELEGNPQLGIDPRQAAARGRKN